jgi:ribonuclease HII
MTMKKFTADFSFEAAALAQGHVYVAGVDEVGRGPLAGPVIAAAVRLDPARIPKGLADSKTLPAARRAELVDQIVHMADFALGSASVEEIDALNILRASHLAMERAVAGLARAPDHHLIDGNLIPEGLRGHAQAIVKGDAKSLSIAAASIVAKVTRDRLMVDLAQQYPGYGWEANAGYPVPAHLKALLDLGVTPVHRRSFRPVHNILYQDKFVSG